MLTLDRAQALFDTWLKDEDDPSDVRALKCINFERELADGGLLSFYYKKIKAGQAVNLE